MRRTVWTEDKLEQRFDSIDRRFDEVDRRFDRIEGQLATLNHGATGVIFGLISVMVAIIFKGG